MSRAGARHDAVAALVDLTVYAPIGLLALARDHLPELASTGRGRVQQRLTLARFVGEMAVRRGRAEIERRVAGATNVTTAPSGAGPLAEVVDLDAQRARVDAHERQPATGGTGLAASSAATAREAAEQESLPIDGYESLAASHVVARLGSLGPEELDAIEAFERMHRNRRTVLGRIAQVRAGG